MSSDEARIDRWMGGEPRWAFTRRSFADVYDDEEFLTEDERWALQDRRPEPERDYDDEAEF